MIKVTILKIERKFNHMNQKMLSREKEYDSKVRAYTSYNTYRYRYRDSRVY